MKQNSYECLLTSNDGLRQLFEFEVEVEDDVLVLVLLSDALVLLGVDSFELGLDELLLDSPFLEGPYPSAYQPPPFREKED